MTGWPYDRVQHTLITSKLRREEECQRRSSSYNLILGWGRRWDVSEDAGQKSQLEASGQLAVGTVELALGHWAS